MDRSLRRHRNRVAKFRRRNIVIDYYGWRHWVEPGYRRGDMSHQWRWPAIMTESGHKWWRKRMMTQPDRAAQQHNLRRVLRGVDDALLYWPTHRDHWIYYY